MNTSSSPIGLIGAGLLGSALAERFLHAGFPVMGFDIDPGCRRRLEDLGGQTAWSAAAVAAECRRIVLSLPNADVVARVLDEIEPQLAAGAIVIDTTTGDPESMAASGARLLARGAHYLDATIGGSSKQVRGGEAIAIVGGDAGVFAACSDLFAAFVRQTFHTGPCGSGARLKLVLNLVLGLHRAVLAEALRFAEAYGVRPESALEILKAGPAYSRVMDTKGRKMLDRDFTPEARLSQHLKDVRLILAAGRRCGARLPLSTLHRQLLEEAEARGFGGSDNSAIIEAFR